MSEKIHLACPACLAMNRFPKTRLHENPVCGQCRSPLFSGKPLEASEASFGPLVLRGDLPVVVDFWASWCGPCQMMAPVFAQLAQEMEPGLRFVKVNTESAPTLSQRYAIRSIPSLLVFRGGKETARQAGALPAGPMRQWLEAQAVS